MASKGLPQHDRPWLTALDRTTTIPAEFAMSGSFKLQFEVIRTIAASLRRRDRSHLVCRCDQTMSELWNFHFSEKLVPGAASEFSCVVMG